MSAEVAVVGLGPAGRALTHRLLAHGVRVLAVDPRPEAVWRATYGGWEHQLPSWLPPAVVGARAERTELVTHARHRIDGCYVVLDNAALQQALPLDGAEVQQRTVADHDLPRLAPVVVDCRGNRRALDEARTPVQQAHGLALPGELAQPLLGGADAVLMDWRPFDGAARWGNRAATFCYLVPLPDGRLLAEETSLAGRPGVGPEELQARLHARLRRHGLTEDQWGGCGTEGVHIAMWPPGSAADGPLVFGAAGAQLNPITGYSVFASLAAADRLAVGLAAGSPPPAPDGVARWARRTALEALLQLGGEATVALFDAFARVRATDQRAIFAAEAPAGALLAALTRQALALPPRQQLALVAATARGLAR